MRTAAFAAALLLAGTAPATGSTNEAAEVRATELISDPETWGGRAVRITGELVGDYSYRDDGVWVQLNDDSYADAAVGAGGDPVGANIGIGARIPTDQFDAGLLGGPGRHDRRGPLVTLTGTFFSNDSRLGGETYLDVDEMAIGRSASPVTIAGPDGWLAVGLGLLALAGLMAWRSRKRVAG